MRSICPRTPSLDRVHAVLGDAYGELNRLQLTNEHVDAAQEAIGRARAELYALTATDHA